VDAGASKEDIIAMAKESIAKWLEGKNVVKEILVPNKMVNLVVK
jgi:leucyl-tRNA synthetase